MNTTHEIKFRISIVRNSPCSACFLTSKPFRIGGIDLFVFWLVSIGCPLLFISLNQDILYLLSNNRQFLSGNFFLTLDSFAVKKSFKANSSSAFQLTSTNCTYYVWKLFLWRCYRSLSSFSSQRSYVFNFIEPFFHS